MFTVDVKQQSYNNNIYKALLCMKYFVLKFAIYDKAGIHVIQHVYQMQVQIYVCEFYFLLNAKKDKAKSNHDLHLKLLNIKALLVLFKFSISIVESKCINILQRIRLTSMVCSGIAQARNMSISCDCLPISVSSSSCTSDYTL